MKLLTLNVHAWMEDNQRQKMNDLLEFIVQEDYDVVAFQEVNQRMKDPKITPKSFQKPKDDPLVVPVKESNFADLVVEGLKLKGRQYYWTWTASHVGYGKYDEGLAILSKRPLEAKSQLISKTNDYESVARRVALVAKTKIDGEVYTIVNTHMSWWDFQGQPLFKNEWDNLKAHLPKEAKLILAGDLNSDADKSGEGYDYIQSTVPWLKDSFKVANQVDGEFTMAGEIDGWSGNESGKRIDYVWVHESLPVDSHRVVLDGQASPIVSDHFGIEVNI